ncbi:isoprenyl transferase [Lignipirellula cremea]|uniref:Isoprenyl transferase n=1 Tax=Lignipirellula cremea TaxID=2528010 RepID=A0A518DZJ9_9BACT|nr:isoprenyl transferase [Lignipirellula cremea]QDU97241.1 Decaprenyl diphosphate synthase-like protein [Lignipirellula cremea]
MTALPKNSASLGDVPRERLPRHIAVIMDGNGRWAQQRDLPRIEGHRRGVASVRRTVEECARLEIDQLTLYCLSSENWKRPQHELDFLMHLLEQYMIEERTTIMQQNVMVKVIGRRDGLAESALAEMDKTVELSANNTGTCLCLAINYGGRTELLDAVQRIAVEAVQGDLDPAQIDESAIEDRLYTAGMPELDLMIRTAGEMRVSNFLLWQLSYAELWVTERCWPEFDESDLHQAIRDFASRDRRFGGLNA